MPPRKRLGQLLTELGVIDEHQLQSALGHQKQWGGKLGAVLVQKGFCAEEAMVSALAKHLGMPRVRLAEVKVDPRAVKYVSKQIAEKLHVLPYEISGSGRSEVVTIAMSDPTDLAAVDQLAFHTGKRLKPMLAGDGEIVSAIHAHYGGGDEKKEPTDKVARPGAPQAAAPAQGAPAGSVAGFSRRIDPPAAGIPAGSTRPASYVPPPIPASKPAAPAQKLEEIEPDEVMAPPGPNTPGVPPSLDLPEDDGQEFGLEPIAAHSQFGDEVAGREEVAGDGAAADAVEGLVSASVAHEGATEARQFDGLDAIAAQEPASADAGEGWTGPILMASADSPAPAEGAWEQAGGGQTGWDVSAPTPSGGWVAEPAMDASDSPGEALPPDAILGTAPILGPPGESSDAQPPQDAAPAWESPEAAIPPAEETAKPREEAHEAEAPDAWGSMDDPLASQASVRDPLGGHASIGDPLQSHASLGDPLAAQVPSDEANVTPEEAPALHDGYGSTNEFANPLAAAEGSAMPAAEDQDRGWIGEALEGSTPLSPADLGTLASIGVDPGDGVGALRLLAVLIRILNRNQLIEPADLREEIRESRAQGAAVAVQEPYGMESQGTASEDPGGPVETAET
ncbi:MAG TPA: hypothetical protein VN928_07750 [Myxococcales bacterium]|nr:hypothetical protein [Myxococcales bacterium]